jgi:hypothetical protein
MNTLNIDTYQALLASTTAKKAELTSAQELVRQRAQELESARIQRSAEVKKLLVLKQGLDLRRIDKQVRQTRTTELLEAGILLPGEEIRKVRVGRMIIRKGVPL